MNTGLIQLLKTIDDNINKIKDYDKQYKSK